jgi:hypothetical protein
MAPNVEVAWNKLDLPYLFLYHIVQATFACPLTGVLTNFCPITFYWYFKCKLIIVFLLH